LQKTEETTLNLTKLTTNHLLKLTISYSKIGLSERGRDVVMKVGRLFLVILLVMGVMLPMSLAAEIDHNKDALRGLKEVGVFVELATPPVEVPGLSRNQLQGDIELRLYQAGIKIVSSASLGELPKLSFVYLNLTIRKLEALYAYNADFLCLAPSQAARQQAVPAVWKQGNSGVVNEISQVREKVTDLINLFIKDYRAANSQARIERTKVILAVTPQPETGLPRETQN
jgi:hypothetical protein